MPLPEGLLAGRLAQARALLQKLRGERDAGRLAQVLAYGRRSLDSLPTRSLRRSPEGRAVLLEIALLLVELAHAAGDRVALVACLEEVVRYCPRRGLLLAELAGCASAHGRLLSERAYCLAIQVSRRRQGSAADRCRERLVSRARRGFQAHGAALHDAEASALALLLVAPDDVSRAEAAKAFLLRGRHEQARAVLARQAEAHGRADHLFLSWWAAWQAGDWGQASALAQALSGDARVGTEPGVHLLKLLCEHGPGYGRADQPVPEPARLQAACAVADQLQEAFPPGAAEAYFLLAQSYMAAGQYGEACESLCTSLTIWPEHLRARLLHVALLSRLGSGVGSAHAEAEAWLAVRLHPRNPLAHIALLHVLGARVDLPALARRRRIVLHRFPRDGELHQLADAMVAVARGDADAAVRALSALSLTTMPDRWECRARLGWQLLCQIEAEAMQGRFEVEPLLARALALPVDCAPPDLAVLGLAAARRRHDPQAMSRWEQRLGMDLAPSFRARLLSRHDSSGSLAVVPSAAPEGAPPCEPAIAGREHELSTNVQDDPLPSDLLGRCTGCPQQAAAPACWPDRGSAPTAIGRLGGCVRRRRWLFAESE